MKLNSVRSTGIGLIEVLITAVVIALGLLAVARFQVGVIGESRDNKAMVEARNYCESGIEDFRRSLSRVFVDEDDAEVFWLPSDASPFIETYVGKSASFTRTMTVENLPLQGEAMSAVDEDAREKRITATCSWVDGEVVLQTVLSPHGANSSALAAGVSPGGGPAISPSLNAGSSDDISETVLLPPEHADKNPGDVVSIGQNGDLYIVQPNGQTAAKSDLCEGLVTTPFENNLRARRVDTDGVGGKESVELFEVFGDRCVPRVRFNGGVVVPIRGVVHSGISISNKVDNSYLPVDLFTLSVSESGAYCVFSPEPDATSSPYTCYVGGNCAHGPAGINDADVTQCPTTAIPEVSQNVGEGGWRGRVGLLNVASAGYNVCFSEEIRGPADTRDTARSYFSFNIGPDGVVGGSDDRSQGVNRPYSCHDFLIIDPVQSTQAAALSKACQERADAVGGLKLATKTISRTIAGDNVYDPSINSDNCSGDLGDRYIVSGTLTNQVGLPMVQVFDGGSTWQCEVVDGKYSCSFTTERSVAQIWAFEGLTKYPDSVTEPCFVTLEPASSTDQDPPPTKVDGCNITFPLESDKDTVYRITGSVNGSQEGTALPSLGGLREFGVLYDSVAVGCSVGEWVGGARPYECEFVAPENITKVELYARITSSSYAFDPRPLVELPNGESPLELEGPDLNVTTVISHQLNGTIMVQGIGGGEGVTPSLNPEGSLSCTGPTPGGELRQNTDAVYSCTIPSGERSITYIVSPICSKPSNKDPGFKYRITSGGSSSDSGSLVVSLGDVMGNKTVDVSISLTNTECGSNTQ